MGKKILFSPIGGHDPISDATLHDGSMLHICRVYKPDVVYLYLSKEMLEYQRRDKRYLYCIRQLEKRIHHKFEVHIIKRENLVNVHKYDKYYEDFQNILKKIKMKEEIQEEDVLYVNIASGTPAMKSALLFLAAIAEYTFIPIQVKAPVEASNSHSVNNNNDYDVAKRIFDRFRLPNNKGNQDYDVQYCWRHNKDNKHNFINRCEEVECPHLDIVLKKNIIEKHVNQYDYAAALRLADEIKKALSEDCYRLLEAAVARVQLDFATVKEKGADSFMPIKDESEATIFEYALTLKIKMIRKEYGDFVRAISPLITDLFEAILRRQCGINIYDYCEEDKVKRGVWRWSREKMKDGLANLSILEVLDATFINGIRDKTPVAASNLQNLLQYYLKDDKLKEQVSNMRYVEARARNIAAHQIVSITDEKLKELLEPAEQKTVVHEKKDTNRKWMPPLNPPTTVSQIFDCIKNLVEAAGINIKDDDWDSYDVMNKIIVEELKNGFV